MIIKAIKQRNITRETRVKPKLQYFFIFLEITGFSVIFLSIIGLHSSGER